MPDFSKKDRERLGKLVGILEDLHFAEFLENRQKPWRLVWANFLVGTMRGLGFFFGTAIVIALATYVFQALGGLPLLGDAALRAVEFFQQNAPDAGAASRAGLGG